MNDSNRQSSLPTANYTSGPPPPGAPPPPPNHNSSFGGSVPVETWMTVAPSAGQPPTPLPPYGVLTNQNEYDGLRPSFSPGLSSPSAGGGSSGFMSHSFAQQNSLFTGNKYGAAHDYNQSHYSSSLYNSTVYSNNYVPKVESVNKPKGVNSQTAEGNGSDTQISDGTEGSTAEGLTARLLDKNSDSGQPSSPPSHEGNGSTGVGYRPWEQPGAEVQQLAQDQGNLSMQHQQHPQRPSNNAQSDKQRTTSNVSSVTQNDLNQPRRTGRSPNLQPYGENVQHPVERMLNPVAEKYQTLTPVPPIPPVAATGYNSGVYGALPPPIPVTYSNNIGASSYMSTQPPIGFPPGGYTTPDGKHMKLGIPEPDSSTPDTRVTTENSFQVPSVSSTTSRQGIGVVPQQQPPPPSMPGTPHPQQALHSHPQHVTQAMPMHTQIQAATNDQWDATNQGSGTPNNAQVQTPEGEKVTKKKRKRCGECPGCLKKDNCGECGPCKSVRSHQICKMRKCDQLKTKKEKVREAAQAAAAAAASGLTLSKDISGLEGSSGPGSRNMNGSGAGPPQAAAFTNLGVPPDSHPAVGPTGPTPRGYQDFNTGKHAGNSNHMYDVNSQAYGNFHMNVQQMTGSFNGHSLPPDTVRPMEHDGIGADGGGPANRHQMMNNRLKSLIQSRQNQKEMNNTGGQNHTGFPSAPPPNFAGQTFIVVQQQQQQQQQQIQSSNSTLSPHYLNTSGVASAPESGQSFLQLSWSQGEQQDGIRNSDDMQIYQKNNNGANDKGANSVTNDRRTPYNTIDGHNGISYNSYYDRNTPSDTTNNTNSYGTSEVASNGNGGTSAQYLPASTYSTNNQSQSYTSPNHEYSPRETNNSSPASARSQARESSSFHENSTNRSPGRMNGNSGNTIAVLTKSNDNSDSLTTLTSLTGNGVNSSFVTSNNQNDESTEQQPHPFLLNTTTSMNTYTSIINTYNISPSQSPSFYTSTMSSAYMPNIGLLGPGNQTVIMSVPGTGLDSTKKSLLSPTGIGHDIDCGRIIEQVDSNSGLGLMDIASYTKSDLPSSSSPSLVTLSTSSQSNESHTVLPPVSTFLLPSFRDQGWWERFGRLKSNSKDNSDCDCYGDEEREYNRSNSPSTLTTLPASLSN